jgi:prevent-host-death family protein
MVAPVRVSVTEAKNRLTQLVRKAEGGEPIMITRDDRPAAVLVSPAEYAEMRRQVAAARLQRFRDGLAGSGLDAVELFHESRRKLEERL